jgi:hypothetical protein
MEKVLVENRAILPSAVFDPISDVLQTHSTMERALAWFFAQVPPVIPEDLVPQDEFSFDLLAPYQHALYLSYATC